MVLESNETLAPLKGAYVSSSSNSSSSLFVVLPGVSLSKTSQTSQIGNYLNLYASLSFFLMGTVQAFVVDTSFPSCLFDGVPGSPGKSKKEGQEDSLVVGTQGPYQPHCGDCASTGRHIGPLSAPLRGQGPCQQSVELLELGIARGARPRADPLDAPAQDKTIGRSWSWGSQGAPVHERTPWIPQRKTKK